MAATKTKPKKGIDMKEGARLVLARARGPLHYQEINKRMLEEGKVVVKGKTPAQSLSAKLSTSAKKGDTFVRTGPGFYDLKERHESAESAE
jgi:hypothetical protein